jgi:putative transposase
MYSADLKERAINLYNRLKSYRKVMDLLNIGKSTIQRWACDIHCENRLDVFDLLPVIEFIKTLIDNDPFITLIKIVKQLHKKFKREYSKTFVHTIIHKRLNYSYKKTTRKLYNKSIGDLTDKQKMFIENIKNIDENKIICIDETYLHTNYTKRYGWCHRGSRLVEYKQVNPVKYSILTAISNKKVIKFEIYKQNVNKNIFEKFMIYLNRKYKNHYFLMDNVVFHKTKNITDIFTNSTNKLLYIPPYSPQFNPIEEVFSQFKQNLSNVSGKNILLRIPKSFGLVKECHLQNYYLHSFE